MPTDGGQNAFEYRYIETFDTICQRPIFRYIDLPYFNIRYIDLRYSISDISTFDISIYRIFVTIC